MDRQWKRGLERWKVLSAEARRHSRQYFAKAQAISLNIDDSPFVVCSPSLSDELFLRWEVLIFYLAKAQPMLAQLRLCFIRPSSDYASPFNK